MGLLDRFRSDDDLYDTDTLDHRLESLDDGIGKLETNIDYARDGIRMIERDVGSIHALTIWCLFVGVLNLLALSGLIGAMMIVRWG